jgi:hypothetical protein
LTARRGRANPATVPLMHSLRCSGNHRTRLSDNVRQVECWFSHLSAWNGETQQPQQFVRVFRRSASRVKPFIISLSPLPLRCGVHVLLPFMLIYPIHGIHGTYGTYKKTQRLSSCRVVPGVPGVCAHPRRSRARCAVLRMFIRKINGEEELTR